MQTVVPTAPLKLNRSSFRRAGALVLVLAITLIMAACSTLEQGDLPLPHDHLPDDPAITEPGDDEVGTTPTEPPDDGAADEPTEPRDDDPADDPVDDGSESDSDSDSSIDPEPNPGFERTALTLQGDPTFDPRNLSLQQRAWHNQLSHLIANPADGFDPYTFASRDCLYYYGRTLQTYVQGILIAFRVTGDLALLDHVDEIAERMRAQLSDGWRDTLDGTDGTSDGYLNWVHRYRDSNTYQGKDLHVVNEMKTHALIATIAYALHLNRDHPSPSDRDYGAHADFWIDYLLNHFEAKWRERLDVPSGFPIMTRPQAHTFHNWTKWHYYMGLLTGNTNYTAEAERMAEIAMHELRTVSTPLGDAYVWSRSFASVGGSDDFLIPSVYARYVFGNVVEFHLEGFGFWADASHLERFSRTFTQLMMDEPDPFRDGFASDVGGGRTRAGLPSDPNWNRVTARHYVGSSFALIAPWDPTATLVPLTTEMHVRFASHNRDTSRVLAALMLDTHLHADTTAASVTALR